MTVDLTIAALVAERYELPAPATDRPALQAFRRRTLAAEPEPVRAPCPVCDVTDLVVRSGRGAGRLAEHAPGYRSLRTGQRRCAGSGQLADHVAPPG